MTATALIVDSSEMFMIVITAMMVGVALMVGVAGLMARRDGKDGRKRR